MRYLNLVKNQFLVSRAWMFACLVLALIIAILMVLLLKTVSSQPVRLVSLDYLSNNGYVVINADGLTPNDNGEYLISIASSDVTNYATWNNKNVVKQYQRFINRFTPSLYNKSNNELLDIAKKKATSQEAQTLFIDKTEINKNLDTVKITGTLRMFQGIEQTNILTIVYTLKYNTKNQIPKIAAFTAQEIPK